MLGHKKPGKVGMILLGLVLIIVIVVGTEIGRLLMLGHQLSAYATYWKQSNQHALPASGVRYVALGDSTAQAIGATSPEGGYVWLFYRRLSLEDSQPISLINLSKSGAKIENVLQTQLPQLKALKITKNDVVTMEIGAIDMRSYDQKTFYKQFDALCSQLPPQTIVSDMPYFGGGRARNLEVNVVSANKSIYEIAAKYHLRVAPLHDITKQRDNLGVYAADWFHPSNKGYRNWFQAFWQTYSQQ